MSTTKMGVYRSRILPHLMNAVMSTDENREIRSRVCADLEGTVVEIGFGSGLNVPFYPAGVHTVHAVEPAARSVAIAAERVEAGHADVHHTGLTGERVDLPSASADAVLSTWTLCSIPDVDAALAEIHRLLKPGGTLHFVEHGISPDPKVARRQGRIEPINKATLRRVPPHSRHPCPAHPRRVRHRHHDDLPAPQGTQGVRLDIRGASSLGIATPTHATCFRWRALDITPP